MIHPLSNPESKHYKEEGKKETIYYMEEKMTLIEMIGFCSGNILKYEDRKEKKGCKESDEKKIKTYKDYRDLLVKYCNKDTEKFTVRYILDKYENIEY